MNHFQENIIKFNKSYLKRHVLFVRIIHDVFIDLHTPLSKVSVLSLILHDLYQHNDNATVQK